MQGDNTSHAWTPERATSLFRSLCLQFQALAAWNPTELLTNAREVAQYNDATRTLLDLPPAAWDAVPAADLKQLLQQYRAASIIVRALAPAKPSTPPPTPISPSPPQPTSTAGKASRSRLSMSIAHKRSLPAASSDNDKRQRVEGNQPPTTSSTLCSTIYTDGACSANGRHGARAGYGVYYKDDVLPRVARRLPGEKQTNVRAEWSAVIEALRSILAQPDVFAPRITLCTDYEAIVKSLQADEVRKWPPWYKGWRRRANAQGQWLTSKGTPIENQDLVQQAVELYERVRLLPGKVFILQWVKGHAGHEGNEIADRLAVQGAAEEL